MSINRLVLAVLLALPLLVASCVNDDYDLSDINTTSELKVKDLTLPIKINEVKLDYIVNLQDEGHIGIINGEYVFTSEGEFQSEAISIPSIHIDAPIIPESTTLITIPEGLASMPASLLANLGTISMPLNPTNAQFSTSASNVAEEIKSISDVAIDFTIEMSLSIPGIEKLASKYSYKNLQIQLPKGVKCTPSLGSYDEATNVVTIDSYDVAANEASVQFKISNIDIKNANATFDAENHTFTFNDGIQVICGNIEVDTRNFIAGAIIPESFTIVNSYKASDIDFYSFSGTIACTPKGFTTDPIAIGNLPGLLSDSRTNISIANPQIYLNINNPLKEYGITADVEFALTAIRNNSYSDAFRLDNNAFTIDSEINNYCLSPTAPQTPLAGFEGAKHVGFKSLAHVLSGEGVPQQIAISTDGTMVPEQEVKNFRLGQDIDPFSVKYHFYAPLNINAGSVIYYSAVETGWHDEEMNKINVEEIVITANAITDCPAEISLSAQPLDSS